MTRIEKSFCEASYRPAFSIGYRSANKHPGVAAMQSLYTTPLHSPSPYATRHQSFTQSCQNARGAVAPTNATSNTAMQTAKLAGLLTAT